MLGGPAFDPHGPAYMIFPAGRDAITGRLAVFFIAGQMG